MRTKEEVERSALRLVERTVYDSGLSFEIQIEILESLSVSLESRATRLAEMEDDEP